MLLGLLLLRLLLLGLLLLRLLLLWCTICRGRGLGSLKFIHGSWNLRHLKGGGSTGIGVVRVVRMVTRVTIPSAAGVPSPGDHWGRRRRWCNGSDGGSRGRRRRWRRRRAGWQHRVGEHAVVILLLLLILKPHLVLHNWGSGHLLHLIDVGGRIGLLLLIKEGLRGLLLLLVRVDRWRSRRGRGRRAGLSLVEETLVLGRQLQRVFLGPAVALVAPGVVRDLVGRDVVVVVARRPAAVLVVAVDEVGVGVVVQGDDDLRVLPLVVLGVVFDVAAPGLVERELAVAILAVGVDDGGDVLGCG